MTAQYRATRLGDEKPMTRNIGRRGFYVATGTAGSMAGIILLAAMTSLIISVLGPNAANSWISSFQNIWLIVIFKLHAGFNGVHLGLLHELNFLDLAILALVGTLILGLYTALKPTSKIWSIIAALQPFLGMVLFIATKNAGRSGVMGAALVISIVMLRGKVFSKATAFIGILASALLLVGDFSAGVIPPMPAMAALFAIGYLFLTVWFFRVSCKLFQLGQDELGYVE